LASEAELETQVELCTRLRLIDRPTAAAVTGQAEEIARLLRGLIRSLGRTRTGDSVAVKTEAE
jgi:four helix bundle protein